MKRVLLWVSGLGLGLELGVKAADMAVPPPPPVPPLAPEESAARFDVLPEFTWELVLSEPSIQQPVHLSFDERGRLWVVEYRQYPAPAGLTLVSHDQFWRAVYDKVPLPPPQGVPGRDRVSIHEDTNGDGTYDRHVVFVDGLNITTSVAVGRGGVWVLNPPYLLFYADRDGDDVPDGDPEVHLEGFGLEDTHSVVNSLCWGPDGWLYAAQGSTVSGRVRRPGSGATPVHTLGQNIWRYHPETRRYEVFAEGGGNAFGVEMDDLARVYSGHNGGNTRGFHYVQGGYLQKGFEKHGQLSNPHAYGYYPPMAHPDVERFTHTFVVDGGGALGGTWAGRLFGVEPLQGRIVVSEMLPEGTTFRTRDLGHAVKSRDPWFKPVDIKQGPDGALYVADWYEYQVNHWRNYQGQMEGRHGRVYRLRASGGQVGRSPNLAGAGRESLLAALSHPNRWVRFTTLRVLADRRDPGMVEPLRARWREDRGPRALEGLWALHLVEGWNDRLLAEGLAHPRAEVREWTVRLTGDQKAIQPQWVEALVAAATRETELPVRLQLAATARRLPGLGGLEVVAQLLAHDADTQDARQPLMLWWAIEAQATRQRQAILDYLDDPQVWERSLVREHLAERLMRRYASEGTPEDLTTCVALFQRAPDDAARGRLLRGFELAFRDRTLAGLPPDLARELARAGGGSLALRVRLGQPGALEEALNWVGSEEADVTSRVQVIQTLGELREARARAVLVGLLDSGKEPVRVAALGALSGYDGAEVGRVAIRTLSATEVGSPTATAALTLLTSRLTWSEQLVAAVDREEVPAGRVDRSALQRLQRYGRAALSEDLTRLWPGFGSPTTEAMEAEIRRVEGVLQAGGGDPYRGKALYDKACAACHRLFHSGGSIGPDLTPFRRDDLPTLLLSVIHPSAEIREGYENVLVETRDDRSLSGFVVRQDERTLVLRGLDGQDVALAREELLEVRAAGGSLMPEGLLDGWPDGELRDLFAYVRSSQPLPK
jgi:putative membrane-bound dehydrogenase-like protein